MTRMILGAFFVLASLPFGALIAAYIGTRYLVPGGAGLANPVVGLYYGAFGAAIGGAIAILLAITLSTRWLWVVSVPVMVIGLAFALIITIVLLNVKSNRTADLEEDYADLNAFTISLTHSGADTTFTSAELDGGERKFSIVTSGERPRTCTARMSGEEAVALLSSLRGIGALLVSTPDPCADASGAADREVVWRIVEVQPPDTEGRIVLSAACAARHPELSKPFELAAEMLKSGDHARRCE